MDCGASFPHFVMDLDHRPGTEKRFQVSRGRVASSLAAVEAEIAKCDVVCANCHRFRTFARVAA